MFAGKTIFIAPLDWGLGHATRCIPLISELVKNNQVILGLTPLTADLLQSEFPRLEKVNLPPYNIQYSATFPIWLKLLMDWMRISKIIRAEHRFLNKIIPEKKIDVVISDNRFGLYSEKAHCIVLTHQVFLRSPIFSEFAQRMNKKFLLRFQELWIPDHAEIKNSLSGPLSHGVHFHPNYRFIGPLSRLHTMESASEYDYALLISGPQPQQSIFRELCLRLASSHPNKRFVMISPDSFNNSLPNLQVSVLPTTEELSRHLCASIGIVCRSGYSSLMDVHALRKKKMLLVPTPGQTEQEYLAKYWQEHFGARVCLQKDLGAFDL